MISLYCGFSLYPFFTPEHGGPRAKFPCGPASVAHTMATHTPLGRSNQNSPTDDFLGTTPERGWEALTLAGCSSLCYFLADYKREKTLQKWFWRFLYPNHSLFPRPLTCYAIYGGVQAQPAAIQQKSQIVIFVFGRQIHVVSIPVFFCCQNFQTFFYSILCSWEYYYINDCLELALWEIESVGIPYGWNIFFRLCVL